MPPYVVSHCRASAGQQETSTPRRAFLGASALSFAIATGKGEQAVAPAFADSAEGGKDIGISDEVCYQATYHTAIQELPQTDASVYSYDLCAQMHDVWQNECSTCTAAVRARVYAHAHTRLQTSIFDRSNARYCHPLPGTEEETGI